jgi:hypothetical protein
MNDRELDALLRALPRSTEPPADLWPEIAASVAARPRGRARVAWAAAAAIAIGTAAWWSSRPTAVELPEAAPLVAETASPAIVIEGAAPTPVPLEPAAVPAFTASTPAFTALIPEESNLRAASLALASAYASRRSGLDRTLLATFDDNLGIVDDAIERSRAALTTSPEDPGLQRALDRAYRHKLSLLRRATEVEHTQ